MKNVIRFLVVISILISMTGQPAFSQQNDELLFYKHLAMSGWNGVYYGLAADHIFELDDKAAVALYRQYGLNMPMTGAAISLAFSDDARVFGSSVLLFGAGSYLPADRVNRWHEFTRGEIRVAQALTALNGVLGLSIFIDSEPDDFDKEPG